MRSRQSKFNAFVGFEADSSWQRWWVGAGCDPKTRPRCSQWGASRESRQRERPVASKIWKRQNTSTPSLWIVKCFFRYLSLSLSSFLVIAVAAIVSDLWNPCCFFFSITSSSVLILFWHTPDGWVRKTACVPKRVVHRINLIPDCDTHSAPSLGEHCLLLHACISIKHAIIGIETILRHNEHRTIVFPQSRHQNCQGWLLLHQGVIGMVKDATMVCIPTMVALAKSTKSMEARRRLNWVFLTLLIYVGTRTINVARGHVPRSIRFLSSTMQNKV